MSKSLATKSVVLSIGSYKLPATLGPPDVALFE